MGVRACGRIYALAKELGIKIGGAYLVMNKAKGKVSGLDKEIQDTGLVSAGEVPYDDKVASWSVLGRPIFELECPKVKREIGDILERITGR
jgi:CO dehydrogenase nickel-insertion accessory protein CooC1